MKKANLPVRAGKSGRTRNREEREVEGRERKRESKILLEPLVYKEWELRVTM